jgi:hypothetical protein
VGRLSGIHVTVGYRSFLEAAGLEERPYLQLPRGPNPQAGIMSMNTYEYKQIDKEIIDFLTYEGEKSSRQILDHMNDEFDEFPRSTLWYHLMRMCRTGILNQKLTLRGAYYSKKVK